jgi:hypothetical protein
LELEQPVSKEITKDMQSAASSAKLLSISLFMISLISLLPSVGGGLSKGGATTAPPGPIVLQRHASPRPVSDARAFINYKSSGTVGCREAGEREAQALRARAPGSLKVISPDRPSRSQSLSAQSTGLQIVLRGTTQLENFPAAKAAFLNAAVTWEALIETPITVVIDVDFGPTWFGERYDTNVLGQTDSQVLGDSGIYPEVRDSLVGLALNDDRTGIYSQLPLSAVPTDIGSTNYVLAPSALWRALGFIEPIADPSTEQSDLGSPPATGFNSAFSYDFDPSDGVDSDKIDFDSVAVHEMGHVLGFDSNAGYRELVPSSPVAVSIWDFFRFRPGVTLDTLSTAQRILSSGGSQDFFDGTREVALSTGRPDGTGGDREQASHWKDDRLTGQYIGTMDPTLADGQRDIITETDRAALRSFGYIVVQPAADAPIVSGASVSGKKLTIKGTGFVGVVEVVINGLPVPSTVAIAVNDSTKKIKIKASQTDLNLQSGTNQVQVIVNGVRSNIFTFVL